MNCKEATRLMSAAEDRSLDAGERLRLRLHLTYCTGCRNFRRQMAFLRLACRRLVRASGGETPPGK